MEKYRVNLDLDLRSVLREELTRRQERNPRYSLRRFAKALGVSHTVLSLNLSGKRPVSRKSARKILAALALEAQDVRSPATPRTIGTEDFARVGKLTFLTVLNLLSRGASAATSASLSRASGLKPKEVEKILREFEKVGLAVQRDGVWSRSCAALRAELPKKHKEALRFRKETLRHAGRVLQNEKELERADFTTMFLSVEPKDLPLLGYVVRQFHEAVCHAFQSDAKDAAVYTLNAQLLPHSKD